jgi:asparagine synthase (glutamine-hydrolysing)
MCGIFALLNNTTIDIKTIQNEFNKGKNRGPEFSKLDFSYLKMILGFHRLAINGLNSESNQPLVFNDIVLICNGEIYNYKELYRMMGIIPKTDSDCEVIIHLYIKYGIEQTLTMLDGVFAFILLDNRITEDLNNKIYVARDPFGVRPLYYSFNKNDSRLIGFASELKCIHNLFYNDFKKDTYVKQFEPGTYSVYNLTSKVQSIWELEIENKRYHIPNMPVFNVLKSNMDNNYITQFETIYNQVNKYLTNAVYKRCETTERPIACLLSGGLDSSLIAALVNNYCKMNNLKQLETYSIGLIGSEDLKNAKIVADYLGTNHTEIIVSEKEMFEAIPKVIYAIESYDTTTVRASIGNYLLGKYISKNSNAKVIFNGDGSDELCGGYLYMNKCPDDIEFDKESRRLLKDIHLFDVLRSDKSISSHGLEPRTPFLDKTFTNYYLSIPLSFRNHLNHNEIEKFIVRYAFSYKYFTDYENKQLLPNEILWRKKEAFSDGVSSQGKSLYKILQDQIANKLNYEAEMTIQKSICSEPYYIRNNSDIETEKKYYKNIFTSFFPKCENILPYYWMPKYTKATDPSARTLYFYDNNDDNSCSPNNRSL